MATLKVLRTADTVLMVRPYDFGFNDQTGIDNEFQRRLALSEAEINAAAMAEFAAMVATLRASGVVVLVLEAPALPLAKAPDAIFPNNWLSTEHDGTLITYPMKAENRRVERRLSEVEALLSEHGYAIRNSIHVGRLSERAQFLEGTGSLIIDHVDEVVYAAESARCHPEQFYNFLKLRFYKEGLLFSTRSSTGRPNYHTNVMMSLGEDFAVVCLECIERPEQRERVMRSLSRSFAEVIEITLAQVELGYCGNILPLRSRSGEALIVLSQRAQAHFTAEQLQRLSHRGRLVPVAIDTIEAVGGGSARCMMAEIFSRREEAQAAAVS